MLRLLSRIRKPALEYLRRGVALLLAYATVAATMPVEAHELDKEPSYPIATGADAKMLASEQISLPSSVLPPNSAWDRLKDPGLISLAPKPSFLGRGVHWAELWLA